MSWMDASHWLEEEAARLREPTNPASDAFNPVVAGQCWTTTMQVDLLLSYISQEIAADPAAAARFQTFLAAVSAEPDEMLCRECGEAVFLTDTGVSHHVGGGMDGIDYARDLAETRNAAKCGAFARCGCDHVALPEAEV